MFIRKIDVATSRKERKSSGRILVTWSALLPMTETTYDDLSYNDQAAAAAISMGQV